ncbi:hypothetical protein F4821DRAFT_220876 [Hypoxylon rubiginosum]|uniref:Uncharacterized protein n=1 Tax=Hypoxylon rubiginosum TaxID=110542 RepID=A0ACC0DL97_9PEZI|nr:hypothetical protein F4821DRAFT_220876 [Hypoxylon rubiginosum]
MEGPNLQQAISGIAKVSEIARRDMFEPEAMRGNDNTLWQTMGSCIRALSRRFIISDHPIEFFEAEIHDAWYLFARASASIDADHPAQDRLVRLVLWARELGVLQRTAKSGESQNAITSHGRIWSDLPFFVLDVQDAWKRTMSPTSPAVHRYNLAAGIARLASLKICNDAFAECGLEVMKDALETPQELSSSACLLLFQLVHVWLRYAGDQLLLLSLARLPVYGGWKFEADGQSIGPLARAAGVDEGGFSKARFIFWKERLVLLRMEPADEIEIISQCAGIITFIWETYFRPSH